MIFEPRPMTFFQKILNFDVLWFILASEAQDLSHDFLFHLKAREKRTKENIFSKKKDIFSKNDLGEFLTLVHTQTEPWTEPRTEPHTDNIIP